MGEVILQSRVQVRGLQDLGVSHVGKEQRQDALQVKNVGTEQGSDN